MAAEFGLISNLISLVCRFIFRPIEEISYNLFAKFKQEETSDGVKKQLKEKDREEIVKILSQYLGGVMGIGISAIIFSQFCAEDFIFLLYSEKLASIAYDILLIGESQVYAGLVFNFLEEASASKDNDIY